MWGPICKGRKEDLGNYRALSLVLLPGKATEQIVLSAIMFHIENNQGIRAAIMSLWEAGPAWITSYYNKVTRLLDEQKDTDSVYGLW